MDRIHTAREADFVVVQLSWGTLQACSAAQSCASNHVLEAVNHHFSSRDPPNWPAIMTIAGIRSVTGENSGMGIALSPRRVL